VLPPTGYDITHAYRTHLPHRHLELPPLPVVVVDESITGHSHRPYLPACGVMISLGDDGDGGVAVFYGVMEAAMILHTTHHTPPADYAGCHHTTVLSVMGVLVGYTRHRIREQAVVTVHTLPATTPATRTALPGW